MLTTGYSKPVAKGDAEARRRRADERFHYNDDGLNPARGISIAVLLAMGLWWMAWAFLFG